MPFWSLKQARGSFVIHSTDSPERDFGAFGRGYAMAASTLAKSFLRSGFADYQAYPAVFLYRHALELYLKNTIAMGIHLASLTGKAVLERLTYDHDLARLFRLAAAVLRKNFPGDRSLHVFLDRLSDVVQDFVQLDKTSYMFRYPVNKSGERPVASPLHANVAAISETMDAILEEFDSITTGLDVHTDEAEDALSDYLSEPESEW